MHILTLSGAPLARGQAYGESLRSEINEQIGWFRALLGEQGHTDPNLLFPSLLNLGWAKAAVQWVPWLLDEIRGIAAGANLPYADLFAWNHVQEVFWLVFVKDPCGPSSPISGCSALGSDGDANHPTLLAQNADTIAFWHGHQTALHIIEPGSDLEQWIFTYPGMTGPYGINNRGTGLCVNALFHDLTNSLDGLGSPLVARGILSQADYASAEHYLRHAPHASANALTLGGPGCVTAFEVSAHQVKPYRLAGDKGQTCHTNHPLVNDDYRTSSKPEPYYNSVDRLKLLEDNLSQVQGALTVADVKKILRTHTPQANLCRHADDAHGSMTTYSMIMELSANPCVHLTFGPPCSEEYRVFKF
jgi:isopenicillin-N N-acyltransferase like protein